MKSRYRMIWQLMEGQRLRYGGAIVALIGAACVFYLVPLVPQVVLDVALSDTPEEAGAISRWAAELLGGREFLASHLWVALALIVGLTALAGGLTYVRGRGAARASEAIARKVRDRLYDHLQHLPCAYHDKAETGDLVQRCTSDVETLRAFLANQVVEIGRASFMMLVPIPLMIALDWRMAVGTTLFVPPIVIYSLVFYRKVHRTFKLVDEAEGALTGRLQENLTGIRVVRAFARQEFEEEQFDERNTTHRNLEYRLYCILARFWSISDLMCMGQKALVVALGGYFLLTDQIQVGKFYFFLAAVSLFIWPIRMMGRILADLGKATVAIGRIAEILEVPRESEPEEPVHWPTSQPHKPVEVVFDNVTFAHDGGSPVLHDVSFRLEPGQTLALLGPSGSGKSTIVNLLLRFYDPDGGQIRLDGLDITSMGRKEVRMRLAVVMQEPFLYSKTLRENIGLGAREPGEEDVVQAASAACVHDSIVGFDSGYDTLVGERGVTLSGGQRQRVAIARALLENPALLILDDALSAVDTETEKAILLALGRRRSRQTTLVIAHRLSTLQHSDRIVVLDEGRVIQQGTHASLMAEEGLYRRLWRMQNALEREMGTASQTAAP